MRYFLAGLLLITSGGTIPVYAQTEIETTAEADSDSGAEGLFTGSMGLITRSDRLDWNIAGNNVNILSELTWTDLHIAQVYWGAQYVTPEGLVLRGGFALGSSYEDGKNQDSDYDGNNRTEEFSRSNNTGTVKTAWDFEGSLGRAFQFWQRTDTFLQVTPAIGYAYHRLDLRMTKGVQTIPDEGPFSGLNSSYNTTWDGFYVELDLWWQLSKHWALTGSAQFHQYHYVGTANWNLRRDFAHPKSFEHISEGNGVTLTGGVSYMFGNGMHLSLIGTYRDWSVDAGIDRTFLSNEACAEASASPGCYAVGILNSGQWRSVSGRLELSKSF